MGDDLQKLLAAAADMARRGDAQSRHVRRSERARWMARLEEAPLPAEVEAAVAGLADGAGGIVIEAAVPGAGALPAAALHYRGPRADGLFVAAVGEAPPEAEAEVRALADAASGGTLFVAGLARWSQAAQEALGRAVASPGGPRLIVEIVGAAGGGDAEGALAPALAAGLGGGRLRLPAVDAAEPPTLRDQMDAHEKRLIADALAAHGDNRTRTAEALGITREGLYKKMLKHGL